MQFLAGYLPILSSPFLAPNSGGYANGTHIFAFNAEDSWRPRRVFALRMRQVSTFYNFSASRKENWSRTEVLPMGRILVPDTEPLD